MRLSVLLLPYLTLRHCACGPPAEDTAAPPPEDTGPGCPSIDETIPTSESLTADWRAPIEVKLSWPTPTFTFETDIPGTTQTADNETWVFVPDGPLVPQTSYAVGLHFCGGDFTLNFTTSPLGEPLTVPLEGQAYALDIGGSRASGPCSLLTSFMVVDPLVALTSEADRLSILTALSVEDSEPEAQDTCLVTGSADADFSTTPWFDTPVEGLDWSFDGKRARLHSARMSGTVTSDATYMDGVTVAGEFYAGRMAEVFSSIFVDSDEVCDFAASFGSSCFPCTDNPDALCVACTFDQIVGREVDGLILVPVSADDCPHCERGYPECPE